MMKRFWYLQENFPSLSFIFYFGSSINLGQRFKLEVHYHSSGALSKQSGFLGLLLNIIGWDYFSVTVV